MHESKKSVTVSLPVGLLERLDDAAKQADVSRSRVVGILLEMTSFNIKFFPEIYAALMTGDMNNFTEAVTRAYVWASQQTQNDDESDAVTPGTVTTGGNTTPETLSDNTETQENHALSSKPEV